MQKQIEGALDRLDKMKSGERERAEGILRKYGRGELSLDEAYYMLLEEELISMPSRCGMYAKVEVDEEDLKRKIRDRIG